MEWFNVWWYNLGLVGQIMACFAIPTTVVMILQMILMIIGVGFDSDTDTASDTDADDILPGPKTEITPHEASNSGNTSVLKIFTIRGIVAFFALGGWAGLVALAAGLHPFWAIQISLFIGVCALLLAAIFIRLALKMQTSGNIDINNAVSQTADVYIRIPSSRTDKGKVTMVLQNRFVELDAITDHDSDLLPETKVEILAVADGDSVVVGPVSNM